jgi:RNA polymerase sigma-70 factor (ECF subfamily)
MAAADPRTELPVPDEMLVERILEGDTKPFEILYERYFPRVHRFVARRLRNRADTEETVQEVFINLFSSLRSFRGEAPFGAWVFGLTRRTIAARFKKKQHDTVPLASEEDEQVRSLLPSVRREADPLEAYECNERLGRLRSAARQDLSEEQWELFRLHHLENRSIQDIARDMSKTEDSVKSHLYRARKLLMAR